MKDVWFVFTHTDETLREKVAFGGKNFLTDLCPSRTIDMISF